MSPIGGDFVEAVHLVPAGQEHHIFAPKPSKMREMLDVDIYSKLGGIAAEKIWLDSLVNLNPSMKVMTISESIESIEMGGRHHHDEKG